MHPHQPKKSRGLFFFETACFFIETIRTMLATTLAAMAALAVIGFGEDNITLRAVVIVVRDWLDRFP
jgi:hypothetical protein